MQSRDYRRAQQLRKLQLKLTKAKKAVNEFREKHNIPKIIREEKDAQIDVEKKRQKKEKNIKYNNKKKQAHKRQQQKRKNVQVREEEKKEKEQKEERKAIEANLLPPGRYIVQATVSIVSFEDGTVRVETWIVPFRSNTYHNPPNSIHRAIIDEHHRRYNGYLYEFDSYTDQSIRQDDTDLSNLVMREAEPPQYTYLEDTTNQKDGNCVVHFMQHNFASTWAKFRKNPNIIKDFFKDKQATLNTIQEFCELYPKKRINIYALNPFHKVFWKKIQPEADLVLMFLINNSHLYPIVDTAIRKSITAMSAIKLGTIAWETLTEANWLEYDKKFINGIEEGKKFFLVENIDVSEMASLVMESTNHHITKTIYNNTGKMQAFEHPVTKMIFLSAMDYGTRMEVCRILYNKFENCSRFLYSNQAYSSIAQDYFKLHCGILPKSLYGPCQHLILEKYSLSAIIRRFVSKEDIKLLEIDENTFRPFYEGSEVHAVDIVKAWSSILLNMEYDYPLFDMLDDIQIYDGHAEIVVGEYYIDTGLDDDFQHKGFKVGTLLYYRGFYNHVFVRYCLKQKYIKKSDIKQAMIAKKTIPKACLIRWVKNVYNLFPQKVGKNLVNQFVGVLGKLYSREKKVATTDCLESAIATMNMEPNTCIRVVGSIYHLQQSTSTILGQGHMFMHRQIISQSYVELDKMYRSVSTENSKLLGVTVDSIKITHPDKNSLFTKETAEIGDYIFEPFTSIRGKTSPRDNPDFEDLHLIPEWPYENEDIEDIDKDDRFLIPKRRGALITGGPGTGKSYQENELIARLDNDFLALCYTNNGISLLRDKLAATSANLCHTLDAKLIHAKGMAAKIAVLREKNATLNDEYSMNPDKYMHLFYMCKKLHPTHRFYLFGDVNQCKPIGTNSNYNNTCLLNYIVDGNTKVLTIQRRMSIGLKSVVYELLTTGKTPQVLLNRPIFETDFTICPAFMRDKINLTHLIAYQNKKHTLIGEMRVWKGIPVIAWNNNKMFNIFNSQRFYVKSISTQNKTVTLEKDGRENEISFAAFSYSQFKYGWAESPFRVQGATLSTPYSIEGHKHMAKDEIYVALSRAQSLDKISMIATKVVEYKVPEIVFEKIKLEKVEMCIGHLYELSKPGSVMKYCGQTKQKDPYDRKLQHIEHPTNKQMADWMDDTVTMKVVATHSFIKEKVESFEGKGQAVTYKTPDLDKMERMLIQSMDSNFCLNVQLKKPEEHVVVLRKEENLDKSKLVVKPPRKAKDRGADVWRATRYVNGKAVDKRFPWLKYGGEDEAFEVATRWQLSF